MGVEGGGVKGPPVQSAGADIVKNMFEQAQAKPIEAQQQAQQLREQSAVQEQSRSAIRERSAEEQPKTGERHESRPLVGSDGPIVKETEMDQFLSRTSDQQLQREAGRQLSKPQQTVGSANAQNWTVANSPHTPESARALIRQQGQQGQPTTARSPNPQAQTSGRTTTAGNPAMARTMPNLPRTATGAGERAPTLVIQYGRAFGAGTEASARAFTGRPFSPDSMFQQVQRLVQNQLGGAAQQFANTTAQVAVNIRGNLVFVKDGKEFRAFKLNKDGSLTELPSEDGGDHPLSPEAQALLGKALRNKAVQIRKGEGSLRGSDQTEASRGTEPLKDGKAADKKEEAKEQQLDFETRFALLLHQVLEEGHEVYEPVGEGGPQFPGKSDWEAFFARMMKVGNQEKSSKKSLEDVLGMIFRGLFKKGQTNTLVGDLKYSADGKNREQKFTQVAVDDEQFLEWLSNLKPGQKIDAEMMKKMFGEEISYLELDHILENQSRLIQAEESAKNVVFNPKGNIDPFSQARLERSIFGGAKKNGVRPEADGGQAAALPLPDPGPQSVPANVFEMLGMRERYRGRPRLYAFILYAVAVSVLGIIAASFFL